MKAWEEFKNKELIDRDGMLITNCPECLGRMEEAWAAAIEKIRQIIMFECAGPSNPKELMQWMDEELED
jgi:hypothetical protein